MNSIHAIYAGKYLCHSPHARGIYSIVDCVTAHPGPCWWCTYAWNEQLDRLILAINNIDVYETSKQFDLFFNGASISQALWNTSSGHWPMLRLSNANPQSQAHPSHVLYAHLLLTNLPDIRGTKQRNSPWLTDNQPEMTLQTQQPYRNNWDLCKTCTLIPLPMVYTTSPGTGNSSFQEQHYWENMTVLIQLAPMDLSIYWHSFCFTNVGGSWCKAQFLDAPSVGIQHWYNLQPLSKQLLMSQHSS